MNDWHGVRRDQLNYQMLVLIRQKKKRRGGEVYGIGKLYIDVIYSKPLRSFQIPNNRERVGN